jgi:hypothetical protein
MKPELLPCPFCGDDEIMDFQDHLENRVQCAMCNVSTDTHPSCEESHTAWNTRAKTPLPEEVEIVSSVREERVDARTGKLVYQYDQPLMKVSQHTRMMLALAVRCEQEGVASASPDTAWMGEAPDYEQLPLSAYADPEVPEKPAPKYMHSIAAGLLCLATGNSYYVLNGGWEGRREGDRFRIPGIVNPALITDWQEVDPSTWPEEKQRGWYYLTTPE